MEYWEIETASGEVLEFATLEEAAEFAEANNCTTVYEIGGGWEELERCEWCNEWMTRHELKNGLCYQCRAAIWSRGENWEG